MRTKLFFFWTFTPNSQDCCWTTRRTGVCRFYQWTSGRYG